MQQVCENISSVRRRRSNGRRMSASSKRRPIRFHLMRGHLCDSTGGLKDQDGRGNEQGSINMTKKRKEVAEVANNKQNEQIFTRVPINDNNSIISTGLMQRLTESNSETTMTTTIPTCCLKGRNNNKSNYKMNNIEEIKSLKQRRLLLVEIYKAKHRFRFASDTNLLATATCLGQRFRRFNSLLNMVSLILIIASLSIGFPNQSQATQAQSIVQTNRALKNQQQQQQVNIDALGENSRQLQLLRSANVELNRERSQRLQRDTSPAPDQSSSSSSMSNNLRQSQPTCGYPGSPAHASVTFNTSHVVAGTAASYTCDSGYELLGPPRRLCQANGTWSPVGIPFCGK